MTTFDDRETAFETKFALDQETAFKVQGRRDRMAGEWAGAQLGLSGEALETYVRALIHEDLRRSGDEEVVEKLAADLRGKVSETEVRAKLAAFQREALAAVERGA
jgi:hypothetical protein